jgi:hypothetical protein
MNNMTLPQTFKILESIDNIVSVKLREILPRVDSFSIKGDPERVNQLVEYCMPITIGRARKGTIWVDGETKFLVEGKGLLYDTSREHAVCNKTREKLLLLVIELKRPPYLPRGIA